MDTTEIVLYKQWPINRLI